eukprot:596699_1
MAQETTVSMQKPNSTKRFKQLVDIISNATRSLQQMVGSDVDQNDETFLETDILALMTEDEVSSLQSHLNDTRLIRDKLSWDHISSAVMHELDQKISFYVMRVVKKLNISSICLSEAMEKKLTKRMSKQEINYISQLMNRAIENTKHTRALRRAISAVDVAFAPHEHGLNNADLLIDIFNTHRIYQFSNFHFKSYEKDQFIKAIQTNKFIDENRDQTVNCFAEKYETTTPFTLYPPWIIVDDQFIICNYFFCASYIVNKLRANAMRDRYKLCIYIIPSKVASIYDENIVFPLTITSDVSAYLIQSGFRMFSRAAIKESHAKDPQKLLQIMEYYLNCPDSGYLSQDVLLIIDRREQQNVLYVLNASIDDRKLLKLKQNHLLGMEFDILALNKGTTVVQCYLAKGIGEKARFYTEYLTFLMCRLFKRNKLSDLEYVRRVHSSSYRHGFGTDLKDPNFDQYHKLILNALHISVNYDRQYVASELQDDIDDAKADKYESNVEIEWAKQCNALSIKQASECPYIEFVVSALRTFSEFEQDKIDHSQMNKFNELSLHLSLDHLVCVHSFCSDAKQREAIKAFVQTETGPCEHSEKCVILKDFSNQRREIRTRNDDRGNKKEMTERGQLQLDNNTITTNMIMDSLSTLHCYLEHEVFDLYREGVGATNNNKFGTLVQHVHSAKEEKDEQNARLESIAAINFGVSIHEWLDYDEVPKYQSFRDEIINGSASTIDESLYNMYSGQCLLLAVVFMNEFGILELMCLKLYTDTSDLCKAFRMAFWKSKTAKNKTAKKEFYWWALTLFKTMLYHSKPLNTISSKSIKPKTLYHGLSDVFILDDSCPFYYGPISTTSDVSVALRFSNGAGLRWDIVVSYSNPFRYVYGLEVDRISCYREENEVLLCNSHLPISSTQNYEDDDEMKINLFLKQIKMFKQEKINAANFYNQIGFKFQNMWIQSIKTHPLLYQPLDINKNERVIHRLRTVFNITELDAQYTILATKFEHNEAFKRFATVFKLNIDEEHLHYFKECKYKLIFDNTETKAIKYNESIRFNDNTKVTVLVSNETMFETKREFELQRISVTANENPTASSLFYFDDDKHRIVLNEHEISSTKKDIMESVLNAKYQIKYLDPFHPSTEEYGKEYQRTSLGPFAVPVEIPEHVRDCYQMHLMVAPLMTKTPSKHVKGKWFKYQSNLDDNGILYGLATNFHMDKYANPAEQQKLEIVSSNRCDSDKEKEALCLVDRKAIDFIVKGNGKHDPAFFYINIDKYGLKPNKYTLRNSSRDSGYLINWLLLASTDGIEWLTLKEHINDISLKKEGEYEAAVWDIHADSYFSYFQILMSGTNHTGEWQFGCCGFELYGHLIDDLECVHDSMTLFTSYTPNRMQINLASPVQTSCKINVAKFNKKTGSGGFIRIHSKSAITIQKDGTINANDCYFYSNLMNYMNQMPDEKLTSFKYESD